MKCTKCGGRGQYQKQDLWGFWDTKRCRNCSGFGATGFEKVEAILREIAIEGTGQAKRLAELALSEIEAHKKSGGKHRAGATSRPGRPRSTANARRLKSG